MLTPQTATTAEPKLNGPEFRRAVLTAALVLVAYYLTSKIGFKFALQPGSVSTLWMPNSILLAGLLTTPARFWWVIIISAFPAHLASELQSGVPTAMVLSWFVSNSVQALIGAYLINYFVDNQIDFERLKDVTAFLICGAFLAPFLASFLDSALVKLNGWDHSPYWDIWRIRFLSNVLATLTLVPFLVVWATGGLSVIRRAHIGRYLEAVLLVTALFAIGWAVFDTQANPVEQTLSRVYWPLPFLVWAAVRFGLRGVSSSLLIVMFLAIIGATGGTGPFISGSASHNAMSIQAFLVVVSVPLIVMATIIEERRRTESAARDNEERLTLALNAAQMHTWDWQITNKTPKWSKIPASIPGLKPEDRDTTLESFFELIHPEDRSSVERAISRAIKDGAPYEVEFRVLQNGITRWFLSKGKVFDDDAGEPSRMLGVAIDITDKKEAEHSLKQINARNQAILRALPDAMFLQDKNGVYLDYYTRDSKNLLVPPEAFLGKRASEVLPKDLAERVQKVIERVDESDEPQVLEYSLKSGNEDRHFEARVVSAEGHHVLSIVRDITAARHAAEAIQQSEERLLQSTRQIRELAARLITAQESERRRIAILLHDDVSQNVAALGLAISRLKRKLPAGEELFTELAELGTRINDLTTQIRQLSHQLHPEVLEHLGLIQALKSHVAEFGDEERIAIEFSADVKTEPIPQRVAVCLYRVALEAMRNVSKHSGATSAKVALSEQDGFIVLEVSDPGHGFDVEKVRQGSGLGLASSEERIRLLQGTLDIRSDSQTGTCLRARVPLSRVS